MTGILIIARLGSTRLERKHLIKVQEKTFIEWLILRLHHAFARQISSGKAGIFLATSEKHENKEFEDVFNAYPFVKIFYGSDSNIPLRLLQCAGENGLSKVICIDGDDILCSPKAALEVYYRMEREGIYVKTKGLPLGMNVAGFQTAFLDESLNKHVNEMLETGWGRIFDEGKANIIELGSHEENEDLRLTLDYPEDADLFTSVIAAFNDRIIDVSDHEIIALVRDKKLYELNRKVNEPYWKNFYSKQNEEAKHS